MGIWEAGAQSQSRRGLRGKLCNARMVWEDADVFLGVYRIVADGSSVIISLRRTLHLRTRPLLYRTRHPVDLAIESSLIRISGDPRMRPVPPAKTIS